MIGTSMSMFECEFTFKSTRKSIEHVLHVLTYKSEILELLRYSWVIHSKKFWGADRKIPRSEMGKSRGKQVKFAQIGPEIGLKQENCNFPLQISEFSCRRPKIILSDTLRMIYTDLYKCDIDY